MDMASHYLSRSNLIPRGLVVLLAMLLVSCGGDSTPATTQDEPPAPAAQTRPFYMGFTPWPYDATTDAVNTTYAKIQQHGDIIDHQLMQGIPWDAAYNQTPYPTNVEGDIQSRVAQTQDGKAVFLAIDSLNALRTGLAEDWTDNGEQARTAPWDSRDFDSPEVITAYTNFALDMIARFNPVYFNYATEASELILLKDQNQQPDLTAFNRFKVFAEAVYTNIKQVYPDLKLTVSIAMKTPGSDEMALIQQQIAAILPYVDVIGVSVYPYVFYNHAGRDDPANLPDNWLSQIQQIAPDKPIVITETGWIAEPLQIATYGIDINGSEDAQRRYVEALLAESERLDVEFIIWWSLIDFQALWEGVLGSDELAAIWRDIGLYDEQVQARAALSVWDAMYQRPRQ